MSSLTAIEIAPSYVCSRSRRQAATMVTCIGAFPNEPCEPCPKRGFCARYLCGRTESVQLVALMNGNTLCQPGQYPYYTPAWFVEGESA